MQHHHQLKEKVFNESACLIMKSRWVFESLWVEKFLIKTIVCADFFLILNSELQTTETFNLYILNPLFLHQPYSDATCSLQKIVL